MANDTPDYVVIDLETSIKNRGEEAIGDFKASPYHPDNKIVAVGAKNALQETVYNWSSTPWKYPPPESKDTLVVGHNIGFDLLYLLRDYPEWREWAKTGLIWDTMIVDYLLSGQTRKFTPLDTASAAVGGTVKDSAIKDYWDNDIDTEDIPREQLLEYLKADGGS